MATKRIDSMTTIFHSMAKERFGTEETKNSRTSEKQPNRREVQILQLRRETQILNRQFRRATAKEKVGIEDLTSSLWGRLCRQRRAERFWRLSKEKEAKHTQFIKNPYRLTRNLLGEARSGRLTHPKEVVVEFLKESHSDALGGTQGDLNFLRKNSAPAGQCGKRSEKSCRKPYQQLLEDRVYLTKYTRDVLSYCSGYGSSCRGYGQKAPSCCPGVEQRAVL